MIDSLGHPLVVGTKVLTSRHREVALTYVTAITKVTETALYVDVESRRWCIEEDGYKSFTHSVRRLPHQFIAIGEQYEYNKANYPENQL